MEMLILDYSVCPGDRVQLSAFHRENSGRQRAIVTEPKQCEYGGLTALSADIYTTLRQARDVMGTADGGLDMAAPSGHLTRLREQGGQLRDLLLPPAVLNVLSGNPALKQILFRCDPLLNGVPFGCMYLWNDFISFSYGVGRELLARRETSPGSPHAGGDAHYSGFSMIDPGRLFPDAERTAIREEFDSFVEWSEKELGERTDSGKRFIDFGTPLQSRKVDGDRLRDALRSSDFVNLVCHHQYVSEDPGRSGWVLEENGPDGEAVVFSAQDLMDCLGPGVSPPALIMSVSCESGITRGWEARWPDTRGLNGMVDAALQRGVAHYIGTSINIPARPSGKLFLPFYRAIAEGMPAGEALRTARAALRENPADPLDGGSVLGLAFVMYGDPSGGYLCAAGHRIDSAATVQCEEVVQDGAVCGRLVCTGDPGLTRRRCDEHRPDAEIRCSAGHRVQSAGKLHLCSRDGCRNTYCKNCVGSGRGLCREHCCLEGHEIKGDIGKTCTDPDGRHPGEKRSICPLDDGWMRGFCRECFDARNEKAEQQPSCPHSGHFIDKNNPWAGVCEDAGCGRRYCKACAPFYERTKYCPEPNRSSGEREMGWFNLLEQKSAGDAAIATNGRLVGIQQTADEFRKKIYLNLSKGLKAFGRAPELSVPLRDIVRPRPRLWGVASRDGGPGPVDTGIAVRGAPGECPTQPGRVWAPPEAWLDRVRCANSVEVCRVRVWPGRDVLVALAHMTPVEFVRGRGPVFIPCDGGHIEDVRRKVGEWRRAHGLNDGSDVYYVVCSANGFAGGVRPRWETEAGFVLITPSGDGWDVRAPETAGLARPVVSFLRLLTPITQQERLVEIMSWVEDHLEIFDYVTCFKVRSEMECDGKRSVAVSDILEAFRLLEESGGYRCEEVNEKPALRPASAAEAAKSLSGRWKVEIGAGVLTAVFALALWTLKGIMADYVSLGLAGGLGASAVCYGLCHKVGSSLRDFFGSPV